MEIIGLLYSIIADYTKLYSRFHTALGAMCHPSFSFFLQCIQFPILRFLTIVLYVRDLSIDLDYNQ